MTAIVVDIIVKLAGLFGVRLSPFIGGAILAAVVAVGFAGYSAYVFEAGYSHAASKCEADALRKENAALTAELIEKRRELAAIAQIQEQDAKRAADAEQQFHDYQEAINATPVNPAVCLDRDASGRVRNVR